MDRIYVSPAKALHNGCKAERSALLKCHNELLADAHWTLIQALRKLDGARTFAKRNGLHAHADAMFDVHVSIGYRAHVLDRLLEELTDLADRGDPRLTPKIEKLKGMIRRPM